MYEALAKYKLAIERAMIEIENSKVAAGDVLMHKRLVEEYIARLALCRANDGHGERQDSPGDSDHGREKLE